MRHTVGQFQEIENFLCSLLGVGSFLAGYKCRDHYILQCGEFGQQLVELEYKTDVLIAESGQFLFGKFTGFSLVDIQFTGIRSV